jgi:hypothetical protein
MAGLRKAALVDRLCEYLVDQSCTIDRAELSGDGGDLPCRLDVSFPRGSKRRYNLYCWTMGHGGRSRSALEYRIQVKLGRGRQLKFKDAASVLLGYYDVDQDHVGKELGNKPETDMRIISAWDPVRHIEVGVSSSCQITFPVLHQAYLVGAGHKERRCADGAIETALAFRPEYLARYLYLMSAGHETVTPAKLLKYSFS